MDGRRGWFAKCWRPALWRGSLVCLALALVGELALQLPPAASSSRSSGYCAQKDAVFRGAHRDLGISDPILEAEAAKNRYCTFGKMAASDVGYYRGSIDWGTVEPGPDQFVFADYDNLVTELAAHHMRFLAVLAGQPSWASTGPAGGTQSGGFPPRHPGQFARFAAECVKRYGPGGSFWRAHRSLPYYPIQAWQIWNEPNLAYYWEPAPDPAAYAKVLRTTYFAIKAADRRATVVMAGMPFVGTVPSPTFLRQLYKTGAKGTFDALALHDYAPNAGIALDRVRILRGIMKRFGDGRKPLWVTEFAWASAGPVSAYRHGWFGQSRQLATFVKLWSRNRRSLRLGELFWHGWQDIDYTRWGAPDSWGWHTGLFTQQLKPKPAYAAYLAAARRINR